MINKKLFENIKLLATEYEVSEDLILEYYEKSLRKAYEKTYGSSCCEVKINKNRNEIVLNKVLQVVSVLSETKQADAPIEITLEDAQTLIGKKTAKVGDIIKQHLNIDELSRVGASTAKNIFKQDLKNLERQNAYKYFESLVGELISAVVKEKKEEKKETPEGDIKTNRFIVLSIGKNITTTLPEKELLANEFETLKVGSRVDVYIKKVEESTKGPKVFVSRNDRNLIFRLLETYVPEIKEGIVEVKGIGRDAGDKTKLALYSNDPRVDAVGSVIGEGRSRIEQIKAALNGEKIELYAWSDNIEETICQSLQPARVNRVISIDPKTKSAVVAVPDDQLSLAIGKNGQNVRLAVQSCGWKIDILPLSESFDKE